VTPAPISADPGRSDRTRLRQLGKKVRTSLAANNAVYRVPVEQAELWLVADFFDAVECGRMITLIDNVARPSPVYDADHLPGFRTSYSGDFDPRDPFVRTIERRIDRLLNISPAFGENLQGQRYWEGQEFKAHEDWFPPDSRHWERESRRGGQRSFTAMAYLNPVDAGGKTEFPRLGIAVEPRPGMLLVWNNADPDGNPNPWTIHAGAPVGRGSKYVITKWYRCGKWSL
jgi:prolyl 4-hydroxylase